MTTAERAHHLAEAAQSFREILGPTTADDLLLAVQGDLGHVQALDDSPDSGGSSARAVPHSPILHILSDNTPAAGFQSAIRGLLIGAHNWCKLPSNGLPQLEQFREALPAELATHLELSLELPDQWMTEAAAVVVFGSDDTIAAVHRRLHARQVFIPHGHRVSFAIVFDDPEFRSVAAAARDVSAFDQHGCLSPHVIYVTGDARAYAERLAQAMALHEYVSPRDRVSLAEAAGIRGARDEINFRGALGEDCQIWQSPGATAWTVAFDTEAGFPRSPLNRFIYVKPVPGDWTAELRSVHEHLSAIGIWPATPNFSRATVTLGASRVCELGRMQRPPWTWHQDGFAPLASLVHWIDIEKSKSDDGVIHPPTP